MDTATVIILSAIVTILLSWLLFHCVALTLILAAFAPVGVAAALCVCGAGKARDEE